ncbi:hypothetical protein KFK09_020397 [Dendrobium nobile]|uniref:Uncharacterized protein n=1 Tax=Dendrobium nobile TaxID=94219 RepID=A0A8T3ASV5_DENNO|nr:hypothetical protein KFK09_020397 [Dendrobium nobile]
MACSNLIIEVPLSSESAEIESGTSKNVSRDPKNVRIGHFGTKIGPKIGLGGRTGRPAAAAATGTAGQRSDVRAARLGRLTRLRPAWARAPARAAACLGRACGPRSSPPGPRLGPARRPAWAAPAARAAARAVGCWACCRPAWWLAWAA